MADNKEKETLRRVERRLAFVREHSTYGISGTLPEVFETIRKKQAIHKQEHPELYKEE